MKGTQDRPTAVELLDAVAAFIREQARPRLSGAARFHALVAENVLRIVAREIEAGPRATAAECERLRRVLGRERSGPSERSEQGTALELELSAELCRRIAAGEADEDPRRSEVLDYLEASVRARLAVDNPDFDPAS